jgi:hypothetical protein
MTTDMFRNFNVVGDVEAVAPELPARQLKKHVSIADSDDAVPNANDKALVAVPKDPPIVAPVIDTSESESSTSHGVPHQPAVNGHAKRKALMNAALQGGFDSFNYVCFYPRTHGRLLEAVGDPERPL